MGEPVWKAQKVYKDDKRDARKKAFEDELLIQQTMYGASTTHKNITYSEGSLGEDLKYSVFFPLPIMSLGQLLKQALPVHKSKQRQLPLDISLPTSRRELVARILRLAGGLCDGLSHLHHGINTRGKHYPIYHCDICPDNILVFKDTFTIADLGLARRKSMGLQMGPAWTKVYAGGTYASPEAILSERGSHVSDLWSLRAVIVELLTWALGGPELVEKFRKMCGDRLGDDRFFISENGSAAFLNPHVVDWFRGLKRIAASDDHQLGKIVDDLLDFMQQKVLVADQSERESAQAPVNNAQGLTNNVIAQQLYTSSDEISKLKTMPLQKTAAISHVRSSLSRLTRSSKRTAVKPQYTSQPVNHFIECRSNSKAYMIVSDNPHYFEVCVL
jgi:hypothetical protein